MLPPAAGVGLTRPRVVAPDLPDDVRASDLDRDARGRLRTLSKDNADGVARHLVMAGRLMDTEPELAYEHAQAAVRRAGRVDVVREAAGLTAYRTGRFAEALRELRTVRRLNGSEEHLPVMADCERGLGRPERALALAQSDAARVLSAAAKVELAIVVSGARIDMGQAEAGLAALTSAPPAPDAGLARRLAEARADALDACGRSVEAAELRAREGLITDEEDDVVVFDLEEDHADADEETAGADAGAPGIPGPAGAQDPPTALDDEAPAAGPDHPEHAAGTPATGSPAAPVAGDDESEEER